MYLCLKVFPVDPKYCFYLCLLLILSNIKKRHTTELANYIWNLKGNNTDYKIKWKILNRTKSKFITKFRFKLCNLEKRETDKSDKDIKQEKRKTKHLYPLSKILIIIHYK